MGMKLAVYNVLVNRKKLIKTKFEAYTNSDSGKRAGAFKKMKYLAGLNFSYYILGNRSQEIKLPKEKRVLPVSESCVPEIPADELTEKLAQYDVVTFDVFDTLIYRYLARPTDVFYFIGEKLNFPDYRRLRVEAEKNVRKEKHRMSGTYEVSLDEIADTLHTMTGLDKELIIKEELIAEKNFCYANPYMKKVWEGLSKKGKKPIILSDMYLSESYMRELLTACGYDVSNTEIIVSCDILKSKAEGSVYRLLKEMKQESKSFAHVGDNEHSDISNAKKAGITAFKCVNPDNKGNPYRTSEMSPLVRSAWAGLVNKKMYGSEECYDKYFSYGYNCGGILIYGYCNFINRLAKEKNIKKILFSGDNTEVVQKIYNRYFNMCDNDTPESDDNTLNVCCDYRLKVTDCNKNDYIYIDAVPTDNQSFINMFFDKKYSIGNGVIAFADDYNKLSNMYSYLKNISCNDAIAPFSYSAEVKNYLKQLFNNSSDK